MKAKWQIVVAWVLFAGIWATIGFGIVHCWGGEC